MQELTFDIDVKPPHKDISLKNMRESVIRAREGRNIEANQRAEENVKQDQNCDFAE